MRDKTTEKSKPSIDLASLNLGLKGMKMNPKKKRWECLKFDNIFRLFFIYKYILIIF